MPTCFVKENKNTQLLWQFLEREPVVIFTQEAGKLSDACIILGLSNSSNILDGINLATSCLQRTLCALIEHNCVFYLAKTRKNNVRYRILVFEKHKTLYVIDTG